VIESIDDAQVTKLFPVASFTFIESSTFLLFYTILIIIVSQNTDKFVLLLLI